MLIEEYPAAVPEELCEQIIACFERDPARKASAVMFCGVARPHPIRSGMMLAISRRSPVWEQLFMALVPALRSSMDAYLAKHPGLAAVVECEGLDCSLPIIERVDPGQGFSWHYDTTAGNPEHVLAGLLYLKTVAVGGHTEFCHQNRRIQPEAGKIALFPPYWTHFHRGVPPIGGSKYVMSYFWSYPQLSTAASPPPAVGGAR